MKIGIFGALLILMSSVFATAGQTADFDVSMPSEDIQGLAVLTQEQPLDVITPEIATQPDQTENANRYLLGTDPKETLYYVYAFQEQDVKPIVKQLKDRGYVVVDTNTYVIVVDMSKTENVERALREIVQIEGVEAAEQRPHYEVLNDVTNVVVGTEDIRQRFGLYGAGQIIAIADSGLDTGLLSTLHPDIRGRVISLTENVYSP